MKQQVTIDVEIPEGYEATGEYRKLWTGEWWLRDDGVAFQYSNPVQSVGKYIVLRPVYYFPEWIKEGLWCAMDGDGELWLYEDEPSLRDIEWRISGGQAVQLSDHFLNFTPPPCSDWRRSKMQVKHRPKAT